MSINYTDNIIERLEKILKVEFKNTISIFKTDRNDIHKNSISLLENGIENLTSWAYTGSGHIVVDSFNIDIILRHVYQKDANKKEWLNRDVHKIKTSILAYRSDSTTKWFNGYVTDSDSIEIENDENDNPIFWKKILHFRCNIAYQSDE